MRSALDYKHRNMQIKFEDDVEKNSETLDTIDLFEILKSTPAENPSTDSINDDNSFVMSDKDLDNVDAIAKRTRSRTRMHSL